MIRIYIAIIFVIKIVYNHIAKYRNFFQLKLKQIPQVDAYSGVYIIDISGR